MVLAAEVLLGALILVLAGALATGRSGGLEDETADAPPFVLPDRPLRASDVRGVRLPMALRGYRMADVDALLDRLSVQLDSEGPATEDAPGGQPADGAAALGAVIASSSGAGAAGAAGAAASRQLLGVALVATTATAAAWALAASGALPTLVAVLVSVVAVLALPLVWQVYGGAPAVTGDPAAVVSDTSAGEGQPHA